MNEEIRRITRIEGNVVTAIREVVERRVPLDQFIVSLAQQSLHLTPMLPRNCVAYAQRGAEGSVYVVYVVEQFAGDMKFKYSLPDDAPREVEETDQQFAARQRETVYTLNMPYIYWAHKFENGKFVGVFPFATYAPLRIYGESTLIHRAPLPNIYPDGKMCVGDGLAVNVDLDMFRRVEQVMEHIHGSYWNDDLHIDLPSIGVQSYVDWHKRTRQQREDANTPPLPGQEVALPLWASLKPLPYKCKTALPPSFYGQFLANLLEAPWPEIKAEGQHYPVIQNHGS